MAAARTSNSSLFWGAAGNYVAFAVSVATGLLLTPYVVRQLGRDQYGAWTLVLTLANYYGLLELGIGAGVTQAVAEGRHHADETAISRIVSAALAMFFSLGLLLVLVNLACGGMFLSMVSGATEEVAGRNLSVILIATSLLLDFLGNAFRAASTGLEDFRSLNVGSVLRTLTRALLTIVLLGMAPELSSVGYAYATASVVYLVWSHHAFKRAVPLVCLRFAAVRWHHCKPLLRYGLVAAVIRLADLLRLPVGSFFVAHWVSLEATGSYGVAVMISSYVVGLVLTGTNVLTPRFAALHGGGQPEELRALLSKALCVSGLLAGGITGGVVLCGEAFLSVWLGEGFEDSAEVLRVFMIGYGIALAQVPVTNYLLGVRKHHYQAAAITAESVVNVALCVFLVPTFGPLGAAWALVLPMLVVKLVVQPFYICRLTGIPVASYFRPIARPLLLAALLAWGGLEVTQIAGLPHSWLALSGVALTYLVVYVCSGFVLVLDRGVRAGVRKKVSSFVASLLVFVRQG